MPEQMACLTSLQCELLLAQAFTQTPMFLCWQCCCTCRCTWPRLITETGLLLLQQYWVGSKPWRFVASAELAERFAASQRGQANLAELAREEPVTEQGALKRCVD